MRQLPTQRELQALFSYNMETGRLHWRVPPPRKPSFCGQPAGSQNALGYITIKYKQCKYLHHRLVWRYVYGEDPGELEIDHINNVPGDDRLENLRMVTHKGNHQNRRATKINGSQHKQGFNTVYQHEYHKRKAQDPEYMKRRREYTQRWRSTRITLTQGTP